MDKRVPIIPPINSEFIGPLDTGLDANNNNNATSINQYNFIKVSYFN